MKGLQMIVRLAGYVAVRILTVLSRCLQSTARNESKEIATNKREKARKRENSFKAATNCIIITNYIK